MDRIPAKGCEVITSRVQKKLDFSLMDEKLAIESPCGSNVSFLCMLVINLCATRMVGSG